MRSVPPTYTAREKPLYYLLIDQPPPLERPLPQLQLAPQQALVRQGEVSPYIYWLHRGLLRAVFAAADGKEFTKEFFGRAM